MILTLIHFVKEKKEEKCLIFQVPDDGKNLSFPVLNQSNVYSIFYEVNIENSYTEELKEYYDGIKERASSMYVVSNKSILYYMDYTLNELLTQLGFVVVVN